MAAEPAPRRPPDLPPKHTIFLSHSGKEKTFVDHLRREMLRAKLYPFFDQNRESLPIGERFAPLIFEAANQCRVAVVVLSPGYMQSKWPMLELIKFHESIKEGNPLTLVPLFFKLTPDDLREASHADLKQAGDKISPKIKIDSQTNLPSKESEAHKLKLNAVRKRWEDWKRGWRAMKEERGGQVVFDEKLCEDAIKELRKFNGMVFIPGNKEGDYIAEVVTEVYKQSRSTFPFDTSNIRGCDRLCKVISDMFVDTGEGTQCLGLYGDEGSGKTTICCEAMCSYFQDEFQGKVSRVQLETFDKNSAIKKREKRLRQVLKDLLPTDQKMQDISTESQLRECLKQDLRSQRVFLVVDNVSQSSREEAEFYVSKAKFAQGSKVLVTSRNQKILESFFKDKDKKFCHPIPGLEKEEASELILSKAASSKLTSPLDPHEEKIVKICIDRGLAGEHYSPLRLRTLATYLQVEAENKIPEWEPIVESLRNNDIRSLQLLEYEKLDKTSKLVFLDLALFVDTMCLTHEEVQNEMEDYKKSFHEVVTCIALLHGVAFEQAEMKVRKLLLEKPVVYNCDGHPLRPEIWVPEDYVEFAEWLITTDGNREEKDWCMLCVPEGEVEGDDEDEVESDDEDEVESDEEDEVEGDEEDEVEGDEEDEVEGDEEDEVEGDDEDKLDSKDSEDESESDDEFWEFADLRNGADVSKLVRVSICRLSLAYRDHLKIQQWRYVACLELIQVRYLQSLDLQGLHSLRVLTVDECNDLERIVCTCESSLAKDGPHFCCYQPRSGCMPNLRFVQLKYLPRLKCASFLVHCWSLETLWFFDCVNLEMLPDLRYCRKLKKLRLPCGDFQGFQGLSGNKDLTELALNWDPETVRNFTEEMKVRLLSEMMSLEKLEVLDIVDERQVYEWIPAAFQTLDVTKLVNVTFLDLSYATTIKTVVGLKKLSQLESLGLYGCCNLLKLPDLTDFQHLKMLCIGHCHKLVLDEESELPWDVKDFHASQESCSFGEHECLHPSKPVGSCKMCESQSVPKVPCLLQDPQLPYELEASQEQVGVGVKNGGRTPIERAFGRLDLQDEDVEEVPRVSSGQRGPQVHKFKSLR